MTDTTSFGLRRNEISLNDSQQAVEEAFNDFFRSESPAERVRESEPLGFDEKLWRQLLSLGAVTMGLPAEHGGEGADLVDLVIVAEAQGRAAAPVPLIESVVAARLAVQSGAQVADVIEQAASGDQVLTLGLQAQPGRQLVPSGAVATAGVGVVGDDLVLVTRSEPGQYVANQGRAPVAWWDLAAEGERRVLASGSAARQLHAGAVGEWKLLTAATLVGMGDSVLQQGLSFVKTRRSFDVPLGTFQAVSHKLADVHMAVETARILVRKAAWFAANEPDARPELTSMAFVHASESATLAVRHAVRVQGGLGFTTEADTSLYFRRVKGWSLLAGDPQAELATIGRLATNGSTIETFGV